MHKNATGLLLAMLALCALLLSGAFFLHARHFAGSHASASGQAARLLPGLTLDDADPPGSGVVVTSMESGGQAARLGISVGDDVVQIDGTPVGSLDQASAYLLRKDGSRLILRLRRQDQMRVVTLDRSAGAR